MLTKRNLIQFVALAAGTVSSAWSHSGAGSNERSHTGPRRDGQINRNNLTRSPMRLGVLVVLLGQVLMQSAIAQNAKSAANSGFSFDVYGDSRSMMYLRYKASQEADARRLMLDMFDLALPEKVAADVVQKYVKLIYDPSNHELIQAVMPFMTTSEVTTLTLDKGWVTSASVEDVKLLPGVHRTMFRLEGGQWVAREVVRDIKTGNARFLVNTGDLVWWGRQADKPSAKSRAGSKTFGGDFL